MRFVYSKVLCSHNLYLLKEKVIKVFLTRDDINQVLSSQVNLSASVILKLEELDKQLKENADNLIQVIDLAQYRDNFSKPPDAWWWYLDVYAEQKEIQSHPWNRFDWLVRVVRVIVWTGNLALLGTLASLFLSSGSGFWGAVTIAFPSILSLLQAQSELTETGKKGFDNLLKRLKIPQHWHEEAKLGSSVLILVFMSAIWFNLPSISNRYKRESQQLQYQQNLASAEEKYLKAIKLDSDNLDAHYQLATLYEEVQDLANAKKQYLIAAKGGYLDAYNNLAYWYIRENKNGEAVELLNQALKLLEKKESNLEQLTDNEKLNLHTEKYSLYKNLGWSRFKQKRDDDAIPYLMIAISIAKNPKYQKHIRNPGAAFCIYAQVLQNKNKQSSQAKQNWQECHQLIEYRLSANETLNFEEYRWLYEAKQQLK
ncbi:MAG: tetratricopeptide repeat protein [Moorea sp. SIO2I5]|nr:tetratricopeptide repeat protein [Moorena sp. SIO2I5]